MPEKDLKSFSPEALLQELRARESREPRARGVAGLPCCAPSAKMGVGGVIEEVEGLKDFKTPDLVAALRDIQKVIYGTDDREDMFEITDVRILADADSVVALIKEWSIVDNGDGTSTLKGPIFGPSRNLCDSEPFRDQPTVAFCSGFLVDPSIIATAAHCVDEGNLDEARFVFGFEMSDPATPETRISNDEIYRGIRILGREIGNEGTDWALVQLDRAVLNRPFVRVRRTDKVPDGAGVHVIGHPVGLPKKYAGGANVRDNSKPQFFVANLDTYGGNSGSAVFSSSSHEVEGILVRGETDFTSNGRCTVSNVCPADGCRGEDCTRTTEFAALVPQNIRDCISFDPSLAQVAGIGRSWKITVGDIWLKDFGTSKEEAEQALNVIKHYGMNSQCFVGRPNPSMEFYLVSGMAPEGGLEGEDAIAFNPAAIEVQKVQGRWKIVEGDHWIMDFDRSEEEARQALSYILRYGFRFICFVGRPDPSMTYFRR